MKSDTNLLDINRPDTIRMSVDEATQLGAQALRHLGYIDEDASIIVDQLIDNALCGYHFAGLPRILAMANDPKCRRPRKPLKVVHETPLSALIDGGSNVGYVTAYHATQMAIAKAKTNGIASVGVHNSYFSGRNAYYAEMIARAGLVGIHTACGRLKVLPAGGMKPALGTNPFCVGFPSTQGPVVFDMGTASLMWGEVVLCAHTGALLPEGAAYDGQGLPSRDAQAVFNGGGVVPFGGHKGYGLSFAIQALGLLAGSAFANGQVQDYGFLFIVIDPGLMLPHADFPAQMSELVAKIKATPRRPDVDEIRIPSERAFRERELRRGQGLVLERKVVDTLKSL